ncbi:hypothetical protein PGB90_009819 [Kerria lacca]
MLYVSSLSISLSISFQLYARSAIINEQEKNILEEQLFSKSFISDNATMPSTKPIIFQKITNNNESIEKYDAMKKMSLIQKKTTKINSTNASNNIVSTYRVNNTEDDTTCILMTVDALITFNYITKFGRNENKGDCFVPVGLSLSGDCSNSDKSSMLLKWKSFKLNFDFTKTPGGERWFVNGIQLNFDTKDPIFKQINHPNTAVQAETVVGSVLFFTPVGRSFKCHRDIVINLYDSRYPDIGVELSLRKLKIEPFIFKNNDFGPEYLCSPPGSGSFRSETAPFIFGSLLTIASLFTIAGYAIYRYLKVNKVQYDTME